MKFVLIGPVYPYRGGIAHYTTMLQRTLLEEQHEVLLISFKRQYPRWLFPGKSDKDPSTSPLRPVDPRYWLDSINPITWFTTFRKIKRYKPDVILLQWWTTYWAPLWITLALLNRWLLKRPIVIICHNVLPHEPRVADRFLARLVLGQAQRLIVQSSAEEQRLLSLKPEANVVVVPHPVYDMFVEQRVSQAQARAKLELPADIPILLFFGIVRKYKGLRTLLEAMPAIQREVGPVLLVVAGEFWEDKAPYLRLIQELGIQKIVRIDDKYIPNERVPLYFSAADVLVAPYENVTGSGVVQMAHGFGLPVLRREMSAQGSVLKSPTVTTGAESSSADQLARDAIELFRMHQFSNKEHKLNAEAGSTGNTQQQNTNSTPARGWRDLIRAIEHA